MIANLLTILIGLWLAYRAIFSIPSGDLSEIETGVAGVVVIGLALWARRSDAMGWHSGTNMMLGLILLLTAGVHRTIGVDPLVSFWIILLIGITVAIVAMWSMLYRTDANQVMDSR